MDFGTLFTKVLALGTLAGNILFVGGVFFVATRSICKKLIARGKKEAIFIIGAIAALSTLSTLVFSYVISMGGFLTCIFCWISRPSEYFELFFLNGLFSFWALLSVIGVVSVICFALFLFLEPRYERIKEIVSKHALFLGFAISASSTIGSIIYSEVVGFPACILCWTQRIFMYPLMFLFALALYRKDKGVIPYALLLALIGGAVALYQWVKDMLALYSHVTIPCPAVSDLPSCDRIYVLEHGYITIPMFALNAFILLALVMYSSVSSGKTK